MPISKGVQKAATDLLEELDNNRLEVAKIRSRDGWIRVAVTQNAEWYQKFCRKWMSRSRRYPKPRTMIKRCHTRRALREIANGQCSTDYARRLLPFVIEHANEMIDRNRSKRRTA